MRDIVGYMEQKLPFVFDRYMCFYGYRRKIEICTDKKTRNFLQYRFSLLVFLSFVCDVRKSNNKLLTPFAVLITAAQYAAGHSDLALTIATFLGFSASKLTFDWKI